MSNQGPYVETDPKKIEKLVGTIATAVREFNQAFSQFTEQTKPRFKAIMKERMNRFISNALRYAMEGDTSSYCGAYPQWVIDNQAELNKWLENPHIDDNIKEEIRAATRKAMGQPEPKPQAAQQPQSTDNALSNALASARDMNEFISIIENYPGTIYSKDGLVLDKTIMLEKIRYLSSDPESLEMLASPNPPNILFTGSNITSNYGMRDKFVQLAKKEYQNTVQFPEALKSAKTIDDFIAVIRNHPNEIVSVDGQVLDKNIMISKIKELSTDKNMVELIASGNAPPIIFGGTNITRQYGMREKFIDLVKNQYNNEQNSRYDHLKPEVVRQVNTMFKHFGKNMSVSYEDGLNFSFLLMNLSAENRKAFESILKNANIEFDVSMSRLTIAVKPAQYEQVINALKTVAYEINLSQASLAQKINRATSISDIVKVIREHDGMIFSKDGAYIDKQLQLNAIENLRNPDPNFSGVKVTSNYGLESKVNTLIQQELEAKNAPPASNPNIGRPLPQTPPQRRQSQSGEGFAAQAIAALNLWFMTRNIRQQQADRDQVTKVLVELKAIQQRNMTPAQEQAAVLACLSANVSHIKFNVLKEMNVDDQGVPIPKAPQPQDAPQPAPKPQPQATPQVDDPVKQAIKEIDDTMSWAISRNDQRQKWTEPLRRELEALDKSYKLPFVKNRELRELVTAMYLSAKNDPTGFNAARIAEGILKDVLKVPVPVVQEPRPQVQPQARPQAQPQRPQPQTKKFDEEFNPTLEAANKAAELYMLFSVSKDNLSTSYHDIRNGKGVKGWVNLRAKDLGKALGNKGKLREQQITDLAKAFEIINNDTNKNTMDKALDMYAYLSKLSSEVSLESSAFKKLSPAIIKLCQQYMEKIEGIVGKDNIKHLYNSPALFMRAEDVKKRVASATEPESLNVRNENRKK